MTVKFYEGFATGFMVAFVAFAFARIIWAIGAR